ncbi:MAG TPA: 1-phosphofructokinase [Bacillales bacterium]|nr:1-phosphofructokinase [Bacillales bacterium]
MNREKNRNILTITLNPAMDVFVHLESLQPGALHRPSQSIKSPGGKGINVAKALHSFGAPVVASGFLGGDNGRWIENSLNDAGICTRFQSIAQETRMNVKIVERDGRLTELNSPSPSLKREDWGKLDSLLENAAKESEWIALCGKLPEQAPDDWYEQAIQSCKAYGAKIALDTSGKALAYAIRAQPDFIKPNIEELQELTGENLKTSQEIINAAEKLARSGISTVAVSLGAQGMIVAKRQGVWKVTVPKVDVRSPVGAGDSVVAGFLHGFYENLPINETIRFAAASGTAAVMKEGTVQPELTDINPLLKSIQIEKQEVNQ